MLKDKLYLALLRVVLEHLANALGEVNQVGLLTMQVHLLLVNLSHVKNLVHQVEYSLGVVVNGVQGLVQLG